MKVLWITNLMLPGIARACGIAVNVSGGWMQSLLDRIKGSNDIKIAVASVYSGNHFIEKTIDDITYYLLPLAGKDMGYYNRNLEAHWKEIKSKFNPNVIHIHGTEFPHGLAWIKACGGDSVVISIQGLVSVIARYYNLNGEPMSHRLITFRDLLKHDSITQTGLSIEKRGEYEKEMICSVSHIIGRTQWDRSHCWAINPEAIYHYGGETIRKIFYDKQWSYEKCIPHSIFISNGSSPIKGLHKILQALPLIRQHYPDTKLFVAGQNPLHTPWYRMTGYCKYIKRLIHVYNLENIVEFTGTLNEEEMCRQYLLSNVFVNCSSIENSSNALGEALVLKMPCVASFVGGTADLVDNNMQVLYRYEETEMLAEKICKIFEAGAEYVCPNVDLSKYDGENNLKDLIKTYKAVAAKHEN